MMQAKAAARNGQGAKPIQRAFQARPAKEARPDRFGLASRHILSRHDVRAGFDDVWAMQISPVWQSSLPREISCHCESGSSVGVL